MFGMNTVTQDIDNDGLNELIINGPGMGNITVYDTLANAPFPRVRTDTPYYSERRTNAGVYIPKIGGKCTFSNEYPSNNDYGISVDISTVSVTINEPDGDPIDWTIETVPDIGRTSGKDENSGTKTCSVSGLTYDTTYTIYVNATDGTNWKCDAYTFTTAGGSYTGDKFYVNGTSGNNGNDGSFEHPWKTIQHAIDTASSGDTIYIMAGVYTPSTGQLIIANKNTPGEWFTIRNYNNDYVLIDGSNCPTVQFWDSAIEIINSKYVRVSGLVINHSRRGAISIQTSSSFIKIDNCTMSNCSTWAIKVANGMNNITAEYNYVYKNFNNWSGIWCSNEVFSFENTTTFSINNNTFIGNSQLNIDIKGGGSNGEVCYNEINTTGYYLSIAGFTQYGCAAIYIDTRGVVNNISIYNNNIYGNNSGIAINTEDDGHFEYIYIYNNVINITNETGGDVGPYGARIPISITNQGLSNDLFHHIYIYSNTFRTGVNNIYNVFQIGHYVTDHFPSGTLDDVYIVNNIFSTASTASMNMLAMNHIAFADGVITINNNSYYRAAGTLRAYWDGTTYTPSSPTYWGDEPLFTNQKFVDEANGDFHLESTSPCLDTGNSTLVPIYDFDGVSRPQGAGYDIGAFEYLSESDTTPPQISAISTITSAPLDTDPLYGWVNVSCTVTDNVAVSQVTLCIHNPDGSWNNVSMFSGRADNYNYRTISAFSTEGNYSFYIRARDSSNNAVSSSTILFSMSPNWDINEDGQCDILDLVLASNHYGEMGSKGWIREDVDNDGEINVLDMSIISSYYTKNWFI